jgi:putative peptidoglycan lipid II flippase
VPKIGLIGLAWGVVLGAFLHFLIQFPSTIYSGFKFKLNISLHPGIKKILQLTIPRTIGMAGSQINYVVITAIASGLAVGSIAIFNLANNLQYVPIGIIGISFATAVFPRLAESSADQNKEKFSKDFSSVFSQVLYFVLPIAAIFFVLRAQIIRLILGTGQFGWSDTRLTAAALGIFAVSVFAQSLIPLISRAFYSLHDTKTPVLISLISIVLNIVLSFCFVWVLNKSNVFSNLFSTVLKLGGIKNFAVLGLPLAFSLANIFNFVVLMKFFNKKSKEWDARSILNSVYKIIISCILMAVVIYGCLQIFDLFFDTQTFLGLFLQTAISASIGMGIYFVISLLYKLPEPISFMKRVFRKGYDTEQY